MCLQHTIFMGSLLPLEGCENLSCQIIVQHSLQCKSKKRMWNKKRGVRFQAVLDFVRSVQIFNLIQKLTFRRFYEFISKQILVVKISLFCTCNSKHTLYPVLRNSYDRSNQSEYVAIPNGKNDTPVCLIIDLFFVYN